VVLSNPATLQFVVIAKGPDAVAFALTVNWVFESTLLITKLLMPVPEVIVPTVRSAVERRLTVFDPEVRIPVKLGVMLWAPVADEF
jgi:hypothetical protein